MERADAFERGLVDELGDVQTAIAAARRLAELPDDAPVRNISAERTLPGVPAFGKDPAAAVLLGSLWPFGDETVLTWFDSNVTIR